MAARFRLATPADVPALAALYAHTARTLGGACYTPAQVAAWAGFGADTPAFRDYVLGARTWVAQQAGSVGTDADVDADADADKGADKHADALAAKVAAGVLGFCGIDDHGHVHSLYVRADHNHRGLGTALLAHAMADARARGRVHFSTWATPFSEAVFLRAGLVVVERPLTAFAGVSFRRCRMATPAA